eukprot:scaffold337_cov393-Prasinococcus_capsulatus_cf.AAC.19
MLSGFDHDSEHRVTQLTLRRHTIGCSVPRRRPETHPTATQRLQPSLHLRRLAVGTGAADPQGGAA